MLRIGKQHEALLETAVVICVTVLPRIVNSINSYLTLLADDRAPEVYPALQSIASRALTGSQILSHASGLLLVAFLVWRNKEAWSSFGLVRPKPFRDTIVGIVLMFVARLPGVVLVTVLPRKAIESHSDAYAMPHVSLEGITLVIVLSACTAAVFEECIFRGYLLQRVSQCTGSRWWGVVFSTALFGIMHIYQGIYAMIALAGMGFIFAFAYLRLNRLWPLIVAHTINNLMAVFIRVGHAL
jgi:membrane protease YdiL (CAAX protease family)